MRLVTNLNRAGREKWHRVHGVREALRLIRKHSVHPITCVLFSERAFNTFYESLFGLYDGDYGQDYLETKVERFNYGFEECQAHHRWTWSGDLEMFI